MPTDVPTRRSIPLLTVCLLAAFTVAASAHAQEYEFVRAWGSQGTGNGQFDFPCAIAVDALDRIYVTERDSCRVQKFGSDGTYVAKWGASGGDPGEFRAPQGIAVSGTGRVYVADTNNSRIQKFSSSGGFIAEWGWYGSDDGDFHAPRGVAVDAAGRIHVTDSLQHRVQKFSSGGAFIGKWGTQGSGAGELTGPRGVATSPTGHLYVVDGGNYRVQKVTSGGAFRSKWGSQGLGDDQFKWPEDVAVDASGNVYVADQNNISKFTSGGFFLTSFGGTGSTDGYFQNPRGVALDSAGNVYVADTGNHRIQKFKPVISTPDMMTRRSSLENWSFGDIHGPASIQTLKTDVTAGDETYFLLRVQNDSAANQAFRVYGTGFGGRWAIRFFDKSKPPDGTDVTDQVIGGGGWQVGPIEPKKSRFFYARIDVPDPAYGGTSGKSVVRAVSDSNGAADAVKIVARVTGSNQPDARIRLPGETRWTGNDGWGLVDQTVPSETKAIYEISMQNDGNMDDRYRINGRGSNLHFKIRYFDALTGGNDVTVDVRSEGWETPTIKPGKVQELRLEVTPKSIADEGETQVVKVKATSVDGSGQSDYVRATTKVASTSAASCMVTGLSAAPTSAGAQLTFSLSSAASVSARILNIAGRPVKTICTGRECEAGTNTLTWNASSDQGTAVPNGTYLVQVTAVAEGGGAARALGQVSIRR